MNYSLVTAPSTFSPSRRPIYIHPVAAVTRANRLNAFDAINSAVQRVAERHRQSRILVHTVSFDLSRHLEGNLGEAGKGRVISYDNRVDRQGAIRKYLDKPDAILIAASLDRGIDLPGDDCRAIVVAKIPYPNLGDNQVSARLHSNGGQLWYTVQTIRTLVQMTGRGMRSEDDECSSYILDKQFLTIWRKNQRLLPSWWSEALVWNAGQL